MLATKCIHNMITSLWANHYFHILITLATWQCDFIYPKITLPQPLPAPYDSMTNGAHTHFQLVLARAPVGDHCVLKVTCYGHLGSGCGLLLVTRLGGLVGPEGYCQTAYW